MINKIFLDLDETLIHSHWNKEEKCNLFLSGRVSYHTHLHPKAKNLIAYCRNIMGKDNVYILTVATREYVEKVNDLFDLGFSQDLIIPRETIDSQTFYYHKAYYSFSQIIPLKELENPNNVLVDNLNYINNIDKMKLIGIHMGRYIQVPDYKGSTLEGFKYSRVKKELDKLQQSDTIRP